MGTSLRTGTEDPTGKHGQLWTHCVGYIYDRQGGRGIVTVILVWQELNTRKISGGGEGLSSDCLLEISTDGFTIWGGGAYYYGLEGGEI